MTKVFDIDGIKRVGFVALTIFFCTTGLVMGEPRHFTPGGFGGLSTPALPGENARVLRQIHLDNQARTALEAKDYIAEENYARQSLALGLGTGMSQQLLAQALYDQGKYEEALPVYKTISDEQETSPEYELPYALLLLKAGQWAQAVAIYNRTLPFLNDGEQLRMHTSFSPAVTRTKDLATAIHIGLGIHCLTSANFAGKIPNSEAMLNFHQALALEPDNALANYQYGVALANIGRTKVMQAEAQAAFKKAAALDTGDIRKAALKELPEAMQPK